MSNVINLPKADRQLSSEALLKLISENADRFVVFAEHESTLHSLDDKLPACLNGNSIQLNLVNDL